MKIEDTSPAFVVIEVTNLTGAVTTTPLTLNLKEKLSLCGGVGMGGPALPCGLNFSSSDSSKSAMVNSLSSNICLAPSLPQSRWLCPPSPKPRLLLLWFGSPLGLSEAPPWLLKGLKLRLFRNPPVAGAEDGAEEAAWEEVSLDALPLDSAAAAAAASIFAADCRFSVDREDAHV